MGVKNYFVADALISVMAQRLVRVICPYCKEEVTPSNAENLTLGLVSGDKIFRGIGCVKCNHSGYKGRTLVYELMYLKAAHKKIIEANGSIETLREFCYKNGMGSIKNNCIELIKKGVTTYEELLKIAIED
jgi:type IV pilus assembly protein PilB